MSGCGTPISAANKHAVTKTVPAYATAHVVMRDTEYTPMTITVHLGGAISWTNLDTVNHDVRSDILNGPNSPLFATNRTYTWRPSATGTFNYICSIHPGMTGTILVLPALKTHASTPATTLPAGPKTVNAD